MKDHTIINVSAATLAVAALVLSVSAMAQGEDVTVTRSETHTVTTEKPIMQDGARIIKLETFDINGDGMLTRGEIGGKLFYIYDTDGNMVVDNIEYGQKPVLTLVPFERETVHTYDLDGDGIVDKQQVTYEKFMETTMLSRFDANKNGMTPQEFTARTFQQADVDNDHFVDMKEWQGVYVSSIDERNKREAEVNNNK